VSWQQIRDTNQLIDRFIQIYGGMKPTLPLAVYQSRHAGLLLQGTIQKAWGNWVGTDMSIGMAISVAADPARTSADGNSSAPQQGAAPQASNNSAGAQAVVSNRRTISYNRVGARSIDRRPFARGPSVSPTDFGGDIGGFDVSGFGIDPIGAQIANYIGGGFAGLARPLNLIHNLLPNMPMSSAIRETLSRALPGVPLNIAVHPGLKQGYQDAGMYQTMQQYASFIKTFSRSIMGTKNYGGVRMTSNGTSLDVWDGTQSMGVGDITAFDLIGQPTWVNRYQVSVKVVMRADLKPGMDFTLPPNTLMQLMPEAIQIGTSEQRSNISIPGTFKIDKVIHIGAFRNPDGNNWCTIYEATGGMEIGGTDVDNPAADAAHQQELNQKQDPSVTPTLTPPAQATPQAFRRRVRQY